MGTPEDDDYGSGDDLFDQVTEDDLVQLSTNPSGKRPRQGETEEGSEVPVKKMRQVLAASNGDQSRLRLAEKILVEKFGYQSFRHEQGAAINRILNGRNALVVFPTGAGKSLCYQVCVSLAEYTRLGVFVSCANGQALQVPAIAFEELDRQDNTRKPGKSGITIIVSPLIALMKDQVDALKKKGIPAELMASTSEWQEMQRINDSIRRGECRLLYCAPERLNNEGFVEMMKTVNGGVRLVGVDEAHCISEVCMSTLLSPSAEMC
jgi:superfamily II DNA helicase RecQ